MLASLLVQVAHDLDGRAPTAFFQDATGIGRMTIQRGKLYQSVHSLPDEAKVRILAWPFGRRGLQIENL